MQAGGYHTENNVFLNIDAAMMGLGNSSCGPGVTIVRNDFLKEHKKAVEQFLKDHKESADFANSNVEETAALCVAQDIIAKEPVAQKAIPFCNITCMTGSERMGRNHTVVVARAEAINSVFIRI